jgi:hypothetical protein
MFALRATHTRECPLRAASGGLQLTARTTGCVTPAPNRLDSGWAIILAPGLLCGHGREMIWSDLSRVAHSTYHTTKPIQKLSCVR